MELRPATVGDIPGIARVHVQAWRETYVGIVPDEHLAGLALERAEGIWTRSLGRSGSDVIVLLRGGDVQGFVAVGPAREALPDFDGEVYALYLLRHLHGGGQGRRLLMAGVRALRARGHNSMALWVLADNPTRGFYAHLGGEPVGEQTLTLGGVELRELAFGWPDLSAVDEPQA